MRAVAFIFAMMMVVCVFGQTWEKKTGKANCVFSGDATSGALASNARTEDECKADCTKYGRKCGAIYFKIKKNDWGKEYPVCKRFETCQYTPSYISGMWDDLWLYHEAAPQPTGREYEQKGASGYCGASSTTDLIQVYKKLTRRGAVPPEAQSVQACKKKCDDTDDCVAVGMITNTLCATFSNCKYTLPQKNAWGRVPAGYTIYKLKGAVNKVEGTWSEKKYGYCGTTATSNALTGAGTSFNEQSTGNDHKKIEEKENCRRKCENTPECNAIGYIDDHKCQLFSKCEHLKTKMGNYWHEIDVYTRTLDEDEGEQDNDTSDKGSALKKQWEDKPKGNTNNPWYRGFMQPYYSPRTVSPADKSVLESLDGCKAKCEATANCKGVGFTKGNLCMLYSVANYQASSRGKFEQCSLIKQ